MNPTFTCNSIKDKKGLCVPLSPNVPLTDGQSSAHLLHAQECKVMQRYLLQGFVPKLEVPEESVKSVLMNSALKLGGVAQVTGRREVIQCYL